MDKLRQNHELRARSLLLDAFAAKCGVALIAAVLLCRPLSSGLTYELVPTVSWSLALFPAILCWAVVCALRGRLSVRLTNAAWWFLAFLVASLASALISEDQFSGLQGWWTFATYGITGFLVLQFAAQEDVRRMLTACLLATGATIAVYALWHRAFYIPALQRWYQSTPADFLGELDLGVDLAENVRWRVMGTRLRGHFLTANQLAAFMLLTGFPLVGTAFHSEGRRRWALAAAGGLCFLVLILTRSKGGWLACTFGVAILILTADRPLIRRHGRLLASAAIALALLWLLATVSGVAPAPHRYADSFVVRVGYWTTSLRMVAKRPWLGVGPGSWSAWYPMLKEARFEETQSAHSAYLQILAENGVVGLLMFAGLSIAALRGVARRAETKTRVSDADAVQADGLMATGGVVAVLWLVFDFLFIGAFAPSTRGISGWLRAAPVVPYLLMAVAWATVFLVAFRSREWVHRLTPWTVAGLAAFMLHSTAEVTWRVPALGGTAVALAALAIVENARSRVHSVKLPTPYGAALVLGLGLIAVFWALIVVPNVLQHDTSLLLARDRERNVSEYMTDPAQRREAAVHVDLCYQQAVEAVPWRWQAWQRYSAWLLASSQWRDHPEQLLRTAELAAFKAVALSPFRASSYKLVGDALSRNGRPLQGLAAYQRAVKLYPSLPAAHYTVARQAETVDRLELACTEYERALDLLAEQYHERNRTIAGLGELLAFWRSFSGTDMHSAWPQPVNRPSESLRNLLTAAVDLGRGVAAAGYDDPAARACQRLVGPTGAQEAARAVCVGLAGWDGLVDSWATLPPEQAHAALWRICSARVWRWALLVRLSNCASEAPSPAPDE